MAQGKAPFAPPLHVQAEVLASSKPTPTARDYKSGTGAQEREGHALPLSSVAQGRLNPVWVEALMGFPQGWTDPAQATCDCDPASHRWPAPPGPQAEWEPPRVVTENLPQRAARLKALGNAVVPQQVAPIFAAIAAIEKGEVPHA